MSAPGVTPEQILNAIEHLPADRWGEALRAIESLQTTANSSYAATPPNRTGPDLRNSNLIGIWSNRGDIGNDHAFARDLRRQAERRS